MELWKRAISSDAPKWVVLIRFMVGWIFVSEGYLKFHYPMDLGVGLFERLGVPHPAILAPFVGIMEIVCGVLLILGLLTRLASIPLLITVATAIWMTKVPIIAHYGYWGAMHESRVDFCLLMGLVFLMIVGAGGWSMDRMMSSE